MRAERARPTVSQGAAFVEALASREYTGRRVECGDQRATIRRRRVCYLTLMLHTLGERQLSVTAPPLLPYQSLWASTSSDGDRKSGVFIDDNSDNSTCNWGSTLRFGCHRYPVALRLHMLGHSEHGRSERERNCLVFCEVSVQGLKSFQ